MSNETNFSKVSETGLDTKDLSWESIQRVTQHQPMTIQLVKNTQVTGEQHGNLNSQKWVGSEVGSDRTSSEKGSESTESKSSQYGSVGTWEMESKSGWFRDTWGPGVGSGRTLSEKGSGSTESKSIWFWKYLGDGIQVNMDL